MNARRRVSLFFRLSSSRPVMTSLLHSRSALNARWFSVCITPLRAAPHRQAVRGPQRRLAGVTSVTTTGCKRKSPFLHISPVSTFPRMWVHKIGSISSFICIAPQRFCTRFSDGRVLGRSGWWARYRHWCFRGYPFSLGRGLTHIRSRPLWPTYLRSVALLSPVLSLCPNPP